MSMSEDEEAERRRLRRQREIEEALEVKSLRRIISAYLNYPDAAEDDVRRYERSFRRLPPAHKALLSHYPSKVQRLRRCISVNSFFIFNMLQAFEPPLDMSQDTDMCENPHLENALDDHLDSGERNICPCEAASTSGRISFPQSDQASYGKSDITCKSPEGVNNKELGTESCCESGPGICNVCPGNNRETDQAGSSDVKINNEEATPYSFADSNGNDLECGSSRSAAKFDCLFYGGKGISIVMPGSCGIPEWIRQQNMGSEVTIELPMNWHEDKNLLGFVLCSLYVPVKDELENESEIQSENESEIQSENESEEKSQSKPDDGSDENESEEKSQSEPDEDSDDEYLAECKLSINGDQIRFMDSLSFDSHCDCYENDASDQVWLLYYPKIGIPAAYRSNQCRNLEVKFYFNNKQVKVEKCGVLIYGQEDESAAADTNVNNKRSLEDAENNPAEDPYNKRLRGPDPDHKTQNSPQLNQESSL